MIEIIDNFLSHDMHRHVWDYCNNVNYIVGEKDNHDTPPTGIVHEIDLHSDICELLSSSLKPNPIFNGKSMYRCYINCFIPKENPYWHQDGDCITCLYYPNLEYKDINEGGETQFLLEDNNIKGILPRPNRMVLFDGTIYHKATSFRNLHRYTIALKFGTPKYR